MDARARQRWAPRLAHSASSLSDGPTGTGGPRALSPRHPFLMARPGERGAEGFGASGRKGARRGWGGGSPAPWTAPAWLRPGLPPPGRVGGAAAAARGSAGRPRCGSPGGRCPRQPAAGGRPRADGRGTRSQFAAPTATRRGGGPGGRWGPSTRDPPAPRLPSRGPRLSRGWARRGRQMKRKGALRAPGFPVSSGPRSSHSKPRTGSQGTSNSESLRLPSPAAGGRACAS